jgi:hypothetical protein
VLIGTEVGDPAPHSFSSLTFMLAGGGLFKPGVHDFGDKSSEVDLYSTVAHALGLGTSSATPLDFHRLPGRVTQSSRRETRERRTTRETS